jgi:hypothetical protein
MVDVTCNSTTHTELSDVSTAKWLRESNVIRMYVFSFLVPPFGVLLGQPRPRFPRTAMVCFICALGSCVAPCYLLLT